LRCGTKHKRRRMIQMSEKKLTTAKCRKINCDHLLPVKIEVANGTKTSWYCGVTKRVPGNMGECPKGLVQ
jgi:hypothetical protein